MSQGRRHRILVVDDEEAILFAIREYFDQLGYEVDSAREKEEAEALLANASYSAVIADLRLTGIGGAEGLELVLYTRQRSPSTRFILLTAYGSTEIETEARRCGVDAFLHKPKALGEIAEIVSRLLENLQPVSRGTWY